MHFHIYFLQDQRLTVSVINKHIQYSKEMTNESTEVLIRTPSQNKLKKKQEVCRILRGSRLYTKYSMTITQDLAPGVYELFNIFSSCGGQKTDK